jgi:protocatechuate 3,4-dioxygenase beta subunit
VSGDALSSRDFANETTAVAGTVYEDGDGDLTRDAGEDGVAGVTVFVDLGDDGAPDAGDPTTTTDGNGQYAFAGVAPGSHAIRAQAPAGWNCLTTGCRLPIELAAGDDVSGQDVALVRPASITGAKFEDADADGSARAPADDGVAGWTIYIDADGSGEHEAGEPETTTGADGSYSFTGLAPGTYAVREVAQDGWSCSYPSPCSWEVTVASGADAGGRDFGSWRPARVAGRVTDADSGDGLGGQTVFLDGDEAGQTTSADGTYAFAGLHPGAHVIRHLASQDRTCVDPCRREIELTSGETVDGQDFESRLPAPEPQPQEPAPQEPAPQEPAPPAKAAEVSGTLFEDRDADGLAREPGEPALAGWTVSIDGGSSTTTAEDGGYRFTGLAAGDHVLRIVSPSDKWVCSLPADCVRHVKLAAGDIATGHDFAAWRTAKVTGYEFEDRDHDGSAMEPGDKPLVGWRVFADLDGNGRQSAAEPSDVTDSRGRYGITNLPLGTFTLRETAPSGSAYRCTFPAFCAAKVTLRSGDEDKTADFGSVLGIRAASRRSRVRLPVSCRAGRFSVRVSARLARSVQLRVDGSRKATSSRIASGHHSFALDARRYSAGVHHLRVRITFLDRSTRTVRATFYRCQASRPQYTG